MFKRYKVYTVAIIFILFSQTLGFSQQEAQQGESITIVTYYPSPYGSYRQLEVGAGGLRLGKVVDSVKADKWTDIDVNALPSAGQYLVSVVPSIGDHFITYMILFSGNSKGVGHLVYEGASSEPLPTINDNNLESLEQIAQSLTETQVAEFRIQAHSDSFALQIKTKKDCKVYIGKILSYWINKAE